jgi:hypothetical protein
MAQSLKATTTRQKFALKGKEATVTVKTHIETLFVAVDPQKPSKLVIEDISEDTWIKSDKGWLQKRKKSLSDVTSLDGKIINTKIDLNQVPEKKR